MTPPPRQSGGAGTGVREMTRTAALLVALLASYSLARPSAESLFLEHYGARALPWAWLAVAVTTVGAATLYNRFLAAVSLPARLVRTALVSAVALMSGWLALDSGVPGAAFVVYVVKDVYIVVVLEVFWSLANTTHDTESARRVYGLFMVFGTAGSLLGNQLVGPVAAGLGTPAALVVAAAALVVTASVAATVPSPPASSHAAPRQRASWGEGLRVVAKSRYLWAMVLVVACSQLVVNLTDYLYNLHLADSYPDTDIRTAMSGQVYSAIDVASLALQLVAPAVLGFLGVSGTLGAVPLLGAVSLAGLAIWPGFAAAAVAKVVGKSLDYSLFRVAKEMLYIPLDYRAKTAGKAVVDMMTYRAAKAKASALLLGLRQLGVAFGALGLAGALALGWLAATAWVLREYRLALSRRRPPPTPPD